MPFPSLPLLTRVAVSAALIASVTLIPLAIYVGLAVAEANGWQPPVWNLRGG